MAPLIPRGKRQLILIRGAIVLFVLLAAAWHLEYRGPFSANSKLNYAPFPIHPERFPPAKYLRMPHGTVKIPKIQLEFFSETPKQKAIRESRLEEVRGAFLHAWAGYKKEAWMKDELRPLQGGFKTLFCGWAATMVDSLDTLWIMGLKKEFELSLVELRKVSFTATEGCQVNLFETTIRYLGGMLSAYDLSDGKYPILVEKAVELAEILYTAFDTPNRMPTPHFMWSVVNPQANNHQPSNSTVLAVLGSLSLEFTRLAQITGNHKYFDAIQRVMIELEEVQMHTSLPGMWPENLNSVQVNDTVMLGWYTNAQYTLGALADSTYEYLPKQFMLLGGKLSIYRSMYEKFIDVAKDKLFFRPMTVGDEDILMSGNLDYNRDEPPIFHPVQQHLTCFTGGMLAIAGKIFNRPEDVKDGARLTDGCIWAYRNTPTGIMPEIFTAVDCGNKTKCTWDTKKWREAANMNGVDETALTELIEAKRLNPGFANVGDARYLLRPEAIESVFILYRITGDSYWIESGWAMFKSIMAHCTTDLAHAAIKDVMTPSPTQLDEMESFWLAETLKYFYLLFSTPDVVNLDEYVLNTEAHPLRRPR